MGALEDQRELMLHLAGPLRKVVCIGAHPDDIEIGAGGTLLRLADEHPDASFRFVVLTGDETRSEEARLSASDLAPGRVEIDIAGFRDRFLPYDDPAAAKEWLSGIAASPDLVLAPCIDDRHQDHRFAGELAWQTYRGVPILEYEIPKWEGDRPAANLFMALSPDYLDRKLEHLERHFPSQHGKGWYDPELFRSVAHLRGLEASVAHAEGFVARKVVLG